MTKSIDDKKSVIFRTTLELINQQGIQGTPISQISEKSNVAVGTIYRYFKSKDDLINQLYYDIKTRLLFNMTQNFSLPVHDGVINVLKDIVGFCTENPADVSFILQYEYSPLITAATQEKVLRLLDPVANLVMQLTEDGHLKEMPVDVHINLIYYTSISLARLQLSNTVLETALESIWDMIKK